MRTPSKIYINIHIYINIFFARIRAAKLRSGRLGPTNLLTSPREELNKILLYKNVFIIIFLINNEENKGCCC